MKRPIIGLAIILLLAAGIWLWKTSDQKATSKDRVADLVATEELILELTPELKAIAKDLRNLKFPADSEPGNPMAPWSEISGQIDYFDSASLKIKKGKFLEDKREQFEGLVLFGAVAKTKDGTWIKLASSQNVLWERKDDGYQMKQWSLVDHSIDKTGNRYFQDRLGQAIKDPAQLHRVRDSEHQRALSYHYSTNKTKAPSHDFEPIAMGFKPGVAVTDIDGDGWDDIYIMVRLGKNLFLRNQGDGTFEETASDLGLAFPGNSTCGIFADFDNDGDNDLLLGRSIERAIYLENRNGRFQELPQKAIEFPFLATSLAAADFDKDGLLDVYITTYRRGDLTGSVPGFAGIEGTGWCEKFLPPGEAREFRSRYAESRKGKHGGYLDQTGPPNWLLKNLGNGQFERVMASAPISSWKNSLQGTWGDFDKDGDPDLAVANDWALDHLFRNDGEKGFVDIAGEVGIDSLGFGMGASWGDFNGDGWDDLFITNMYSKAGQRILSQFKEVDEQFLQSAFGNFLYRQKNGRFEEITSTSNAHGVVAHSGWSWGGQFFDFDNDRDLDIYAMSGYFTAPRTFESDIDL